MTMDTNNNIENKKNKIYKFLFRKTSLISDIIICTAAVIAGYCYYYENRIIIHTIENPEKVNAALKIIICAVIIIVWCVICFQNGVKQRYSFLIFTLCIWVIPQIIKYRIDSLDKESYKNDMVMRSITALKYAAGIFYLSLKALGDQIYIYIKIPYVITLNLIIMTFAAMFALGNLIFKYFDKNGENL